MTTAAKVRRQEEARERLRQILHPGDTVYTVLRHRSSSGMSRSISPIVIRDGRPQDLTFLVAPALGSRRDERNDGIIRGGAGMDMGFELVYNLSMALFCENGYTSEGAYALKQEWL